MLIAVLAVVAGLAAGAVGGAFRWVLDRADAWRSALAEWAHTVPFGVIVPVLVVAACAALAAALVRLSPRSAGSGIQDVDAVFRGELGPQPFSVVPIRFACGALAIGSGLVLGREGPTVHMGAAIGALAARGAKLGDDDSRSFQTALSAAGLAVAFNAPIGGALFALEEVARRSVGRCSRSKRSRAPPASDCSCRPCSRWPPPSRCLV